MRINNNLMALNAHRYLSSAGARQSRSLEKISSGLRINSAADDAAGLAISEKMRAQISGLEQAETNAQNGISLIQTAEGALNETHSILQRMRQLAVDSSNDTNTDDDRAEIQKEVDELATEITRIANTTEFNTKSLLDGTFTGAFHIGANEDQSMQLNLASMNADDLNVSGAGETEGAGIDVSTQEAGSAAISVIDSAINTVSAERSKLGAYQNRLEHTIYNLSTTKENLQASESRIRDVDVAKEMMEFVKLNILGQASQSMLAQANQAPQGVLQLLG